jgi:hypothetical protein
MTEQVLNPNLNKNRRGFIGGSDARVIMGDDEARLVGCGGRSAARSNQRTSPRI